MKRTIFILVVMALLSGCAGLEIGTPYKMNNQSMADNNATYLATAGTEVVIGVFALLWDKAEKNYRIEAVNDKAPCSDKWCE